MSIMGMIRSKSKKMINLQSWMKLINEVNPYSIFRKKQSYRTSFHQLFPNMNNVFCKPLSFQSWKVFSFGGILNHFH